MQLNNSQQISLVGMDTSSSCIVSQPQKNGNKGGLDKKQHKKRIQISGFSLVSLALNQ